MSKFIYKIRFLIILIPVLAVIIVYAPILHYGKIWDDWLLLGDFASYKDASYWRYPLTNPLPFSENYYRPLVIFSFILESYFGFGDFESHLFNVLIHGFNGLLLTLIALRFWPVNNTAVHRISAVGVGLIYVLHPAMTEGVIWIAGRFDLMVTTFVFAAILVDTSEIKIKIKLFLIGILFLAALLCKEMAIILPPVLVLLNLATTGIWNIKQIFKRDRIAVLAALIIGLVVYLGIRFSALGYILVQDKEMAFLNFGSPLQRILLIGAAFFGYFKTIFIPFLDIQPLHYVSLPIAIDNLSAWGGLLMLIGSLFTFLVVARRGGDKYLSACFLAGIISLIPVLHLIPVPMLLANMLTADRAVMIPVALVMLGLGGLVGKLENSNKIYSISIISSMWIFISILIIKSTFLIWSNDYSLWKWLSSSEPRCSYCKSNFAKLSIYVTGPESALKEAKLALLSADQPWQAAVALSIQAAALEKLGRIDEAINAAQTAIQTEKVDHAKIGYEILSANLLIKAHRYEEANKILDSALSLGGSYRLDALKLLGKMALETDRPDIARTMFKEAYAFSSKKKLNDVLAITDDPELWMRLGKKFAAERSDKEASAAFEEAKRLREKTTLLMKPSQSQ